MANIVNGRYALAEPGSGITVLSMEGAEINLFGTHTIIEASKCDFYTPVKDFLTQKLVEEKKETMFTVGNAYSAVLAGVAAVAVVAAVVAGPGVVALCLLGGACMSGMASKAAGDYTMDAVEEMEKGNDISWLEFVHNLRASAREGAKTGACIYGIALVVSAPTIITAYLDAAFLSSLFGFGGMNAGTAALSAEAVATAGAAATAGTVATAVELNSLQGIYAEAAKAIVSLIKKDNSVGVGGKKEGVHFEERSSGSEHMLGSNGSQVSSKTTWQNGSTERIDVENPAPGRRPGQIHYHDANNNKYYYNIGNNEFYNPKTGELAPNNVQNLLRDKSFMAGIKKAIEILGE